MCFDFRCKNCGHSEAHHTEGNQWDKIEGYRYSLGECVDRGGYQLTKTNHRKELKCFEAEGVSDTSGLLSKFESARAQREMERNALIGD